MAGQKSSGRGRTGGTAQGGVGRPGGTGRQGGNRQGTGRANQGQPRQGPATATTKTAGNGAKSAGSRSGAKQPASATPARGATAVARGAANGAGQSAASGWLGGRIPSVGLVPLTTFLLTLYGLGASIYLTIAHYDASVTLVCSDKGLVNCAEVTTSPQSMVFGVFPVAVLGLAYYVFMTVLNSPWVWRLQQDGSEQLSTRLRYTRLAAVVAGMAFVLYLIYAELIQIGAICLWCTSVHVATFLLFTLVVFSTSFSSQTPASRRR
jgi:uncharacterized membrane protein